MMDILRIEDALRKLGNFSIQITFNSYFQLYNPCVEGDAIFYNFETFSELIEFIEAHDLEAI